MIACDNNAVRAVYNGKIIDQVLDGLSPQLSNAEQARIRNRVLKELIRYQCEKGADQTRKDMKAPVPFSESHKYNGMLNYAPETLEVIPGKDGVIR